MGVESSVFNSKGQLIGYRINGSLFSEVQTEKLKGLKERAKEGTLTEEPPYVFTGKELSRLAFTIWRMSQQGDPRVTTRALQRVEPSGGRR